MENKKEKIISFVKLNLERFSREIVKGEYEYITFDHVILEIRDFILKHKADDLMKDKDFLLNLKNNLVSFFEETFIWFKFKEKIIYSFNLYFKLK